MAVIKRSELFLSHSTFSKFQSVLLLLQRGNHTSSGEEGCSSLSKLEAKDNVDPSIWKTYDSRDVRIRNYTISRPAWTVLSVLHKKGYEAYLVGGCVRDLLLNRIPKDFDIITTATLRQVRRVLYPCYIFGRRFPICQVHLHGAIIEVTSFTKEGEEQSKGKNVIQHKALDSCNKKDILRWEDSTKRDFTINSLYLDPAKYKVYDYVNGMKDLRSSKIRTVIPAHLSFKEDCARILRGLRIAARLGFDLCEETSKAVHEFSSLVHDLDKTRLYMELNFMLCYGAARSSVQLLHQYQLLEIFLPVHAAYLNASKTHSDSMLMNLLSNMDKLLAPDRPCDSILWLGLLGFHMAFISHPQNPTVIQLFSTLLYHGSWSKAMHSTKQMEYKNSSVFPPESKELSLEEENMLELRKEIMDFSLQVKRSVSIFTSIDCINKHRERYESAEFCGKTIISEKKKRYALELFNGLDCRIESYNKPRKSYEISYELLKTGNLDETRFVLGKILMDTISPKEKPIEKRNVVTKKEEVVRDDSTDSEYLVMKVMKKEEVVSDDSTDSEYLVMKLMENEKVVRDDSTNSEYLVMKVIKKEEVVRDDSTNSEYLVMKKKEVVRDDSTDSEYLSYGESESEDEEESLREIQKVLDKLKYSKGIKHNLTAKEVLAERNNLEVAISYHIFSDSEEEVVLPAHEEFIMSHYHLKKPTEKEVAAFRERRLKNKNTSKKAKKERVSHSLNTRDGFKKRDNKTKKNKQTLSNKTVNETATLNTRDGFKKPDNKNKQTPPNKTVNETVKNGSEMNNESTNKVNKTNNTKNETLASLFK